MFLEDPPFQGATQAEQRASPRYWAEHMVYVLRTVDGAAAKNLTTSTSLSRSRKTRADREQKKARSGSGLKSKTRDVLKETAPL
jgi:hypothetical protein